MIINSSNSSLTRKETTLPNLQDSNELLNSKSRFSINPLYQLQGFAYEAATTLINWASEHYPLKKVIAHCDDRNIPSYKLMEKLGMHLECIHKDVKIVKKDGVHLRDERLYSMNITKKGN